MKKKLKIEAAILAGGFSSRMGENKAGIALDGVTLLDRVRAAASQLEIPIAVIKKDVVKRCGPLGGMVTAFAKSTADAILFLSCDMPFITGQFLHRLIAVSGNAFASFPRGRTKSRPGFPLLLARSALPVIERQIKSGEFSIHALADELKPALIRLPPKQARIELLNINTSRDLAEAKKIVSKPSSSGPVLEVSHLTIRRGKTTILDDLSWRLQSGENWVILGANGSGKTSLLTTLMGYLTPTSGAVRVLGKQYGRTDWRDLRRRIGMVSSAIRQMMGDSEPALLSVVSGKYAQIDYWGKPKVADREQALEILEQVKCVHLADRPWLYLSQGERQRILIARALMARPALLILDEPCAGLDPAARESFLQFIETLARSPQAPPLVLVTHHVEEIVPCFTHALLLKKGKTLGSGILHKTLSSAYLSEAFDTPMRLRKSRDRYHLDLVKSAPTA